MGILILAIAVGMTAAIVALVSGYSVWMALALYSSFGILSVLLSIGVVITAPTISSRPTQAHPRQSDAI